MKTDTRSSAVHETPVQFLKGIGPVRAEVLAKHEIRTLRDLLFHVPRRYLDRSAIVPISHLRDVSKPGSSDADASQPIRFYTVVAEVRSFRTIGYRRKARLVVVLADETGSMQSVWFGGVQYWKSRFTVGEVVAVSGTPSYYGNILQFIHPEVDRISERSSEGGASGVENNPSRFLNTGGLVPLYPSGADLDRVGLDSAGFRRVIRGMLATYQSKIQDVLPEAIRHQRDLLPFAEAIQTVHQPASKSELQKSLLRLKYEEFFLFQLLLATRRRAMKERANGISFTVKSRLARQLVDSLPFDLTDAQVRVINEITSDMESTKPLSRLLQGDVGSGKTIVALTAMLIAIENGYQAAFMAPTEILAVQHFRTISSFLRGIDVNVRLLVGKQKSRLRRDVLEDVRRGSAQIVVGTHALFEEEVEFAKLGFVVIDEQHRFGVVQRASLQSKGELPDVLIMTATPIPRTLSLTLYGDLDVSVIDKLPGGRVPIETILRHDKEREEVQEFTREQIRLGRQAYYVYPLIEESEKVDLKAATVHYDHLAREVFPDLKVDLIHGRLANEEKEKVMSRFHSGQIDILVATTVIEVGIDVPNATLMVVENAERFGLSQLHQLRGRIGRGSMKSYCILLSKTRPRKKSEALFDGAGEEEQAHLAEKRLQTMVSTTDGFRIAEVDLQLRGPGDFFGTRQSGIPLFKVANLVDDTEILDQARKDAFELAEKDHGLTFPDHRLLAEYLEATAKHSRSHPGTA